LYPALGLTEGTYPPSDLPDNVTVNGVSYPRNVGTGNEASYGDENNGVALEIAEWLYYNEGIAASQECLIQGEVEDQFADTYTVTYTPGGDPRESVVVTRISLCVWSGNDSCGRPWYLMYGDQAPFFSGDEFKWYIWMAIDESDPCGDFQQPPAEKQGFQNSPIGNYAGDAQGTVS
jgi:hypothetical protein